MNTPSSRHDIRNVLLCVVVVLVACFATEPFVEIGVNDDWSYIRSAQDLAHTGRIIYNGWAAAMLGAQLYWGALFALLFGPSYTAVRLSCIPLGLLCVFLCYVIFRRSGIAPTPAIFGTLTLGLSPLFLPHAVTFMSEIPSLALFLAAIYAFCRADEKRSGLDNLGAFAFWLTLGTVFGAVGGTIRQINWILALVAPATMAARIFTARHTTTSRRATTAQLAICATSFLAILGFAAVVSLWYARQPYSIVEKTGTALPAFYAEVLKDARFLFKTFCCFSWTLVLLSLPVVPLAPRLFWQPPLRKNWIPFLGAAVLLVTLWFNFLLPPDLRFPWMVNTVTESGVWPGVAFYYRFGDGLPHYLTPSFVLCLSYVVTFAATVMLANAVSLFWQASVRRAIPFAMVLWIVFATLYVPTLWIKMFLPFSGVLFDRYVLPLFPGFVLGLLWLGRSVGNTEGETIPIASPARSRYTKVGYGLGTVLLASFGYFAVATTSDHFRQCEAVLRLTDRMTRAGIDRQYIDGGMAYDAQTQLALTGHYNDPRLTVPSGAFRPETQEPRPQYPMMIFTPDVWGVFCVTTPPDPKLFPLNMAPEPVKSRYMNYHFDLYIQTHNPKYAGMTVEQIATTISREPPITGYPPKSSAQNNAKRP